MVKKILTRVLWFFSFTVLSLPAVSQEKTVIPVLDGVIADLGNSAQQIEVRAKSLGPGACGVEFFIGGEKTSFLAPPLTWSSWVKTSPAFLSENTVSIGFKEVCDTGAVAEARFYGR